MKKQTRNFRPLKILDTPFFYAISILSKWRISVIIHTESEGFYALYHFTDKNNENNDPLQTICHATAVGKSRVAFSEYKDVNSIRYYAFHACERSIGYTDKTTL